jgi:prepilin-type N-terminal cleavage/methylation domain-containing protein
MNDPGCDGFTLMETLVSIAVILVISCSVFIALSSGIKANSASVRVIRTANRILDTDRFIRKQAESLHIPYWLKPDGPIEAFKYELWRSRIGNYLQSVTTLYDASGAARGVTVEYRIGNRNIQSSVLFPSRPLIGSPR